MLSYKNIADLDLIGCINRVKLREKFRLNIIQMW